MPARSLHLVFILISFFKRQSMVSCAFFLLLNKKLYPHYHPLLHGPWIWSSFHIKNTIHCADSIMSACHSVMSVCYSIVFLSFNYVRLSFNYVFLSFNYYISSCLLDIQLCSILSFNYYFLSLNYPWSFSHLIITVCHAISYLMNFIELWLVAIQLVNIVSISIDRLYLSPQKHRWLLTNVFGQASSRLSCTRLENGLEGISRCERFQRKRRKLSTGLTLLNDRWISWGHHARRQIICNSFQRIDM